MRDGACNQNVVPDVLGSRREDYGEWNPVNAQDEYRHKASECLDLASKTAAGTGGAWNKFMAMAMLWLRLAEESERLNRFNTPSHDPT
jgi:hypothetical protein